jgi:hypothetical protein
MKLHPPEVVIDPNNPFEHALFGRKEFAESLTALLRNVSEGLVIFVNAPWGEGKTTFANMWRSHLENREKLDVIYFDAYAADYFDDPFVSFTGEILELVDKRLADAKGVPESRKEFKKTAIEVGKRMGGLLTKIALKAATLNVIEAAHVEEMKDITSSLADGVSEIGADLIEKKIEGYTSEKDALKAFKESLKALAAIVRKEQEFPLTIIVDELDRCRPDFALQLLERIKHLFDVEGVAFVLLVNREQIESYVRTVYGEKVDAPAYLLKFANLFVDLPNQQPIFHEEKGRRDYCQMLIKHHEFLESVKEEDFFIRSLTLVIELHDLTLREMEKVFVELSLYYTSLPQNQITNEFLIATLAVLKIKKPDAYGSLKMTRLPFDQFMRETRLDTLPNDASRGVSKDWIQGFVGFLLMPDQDLQKKLQEDPDPNKGAGRYGRWLMRFDLDRKKVIPFLCSRLDRFSVNS